MYLLEELGRVAVWSVRADLQLILLQFAVSVSVLYSKAVALPIVGRAETEAGASHLIDAPAVRQALVVDQSDPAALVLPDNYTCSVF